MSETTEVFFYFKPPSNSGAIETTRRGNEAKLMNPTRGILGQKCSWESGSLFCIIQLTLHKGVKHGETMKVYLGKSL